MTVAKKPKAESDVEAPKKKAVKKTKKDDLGHSAHVEESAASTPVKSSSQSSVSSDAIAKGQPVVNIGFVGHVDHGKTTLTQALSGKWTDTHSEEIKRGITIRLGYADAVFYQTASGEYTTSPTDSMGRANKATRKVSFIDAPGHESLMATMLAGSMIMDGALLLISASETCPQPQTREHLSALEMCDIKNVIVVQNKIDMVDEEQARKNYQQIKDFLKGTPYENAPVVPVSAVHKININYLIEAIETVVPTPVRNPNEDPMFLVARSFDVNKPGTEPKDLKGGILGGSLVRGKISVGDTIEIRPGRVMERKNQLAAVSYKTQVVSLVTGGKSVQSIQPGGSVGILTKLDPAIVKADKLTGCVVGHVDKLPPVWVSTLKLDVHLLDRVVGSVETAAVDPLRKMEPLMLNVNSATTVGVITELSKKEVVCTLKLPICADVGSRVTISRRIGNRFRLIGYGIILA
ncbi:MAG TPA: translation initiation factor IF-2 subunit gamma [Acidobacteriota bacterium]|nr:translation initiation factor IF-2 subunit gamma [Acidobacteriota bacterium]